MEEAGPDESAGIGTLDVARDGFNSSETPNRPRQRPPPLNLHSRRLSASLASPSSPDLVDAFAKQLRTKATRSPSALTRSLTLPRINPKSPVRELDLEATLNVAPSLDAEATVKVRNWILCVALVNFDLDQGPVMHGVCPRFEFSAAERENICFSSFPDSSHFEEGHEVHSFRIRRSQDSGTKRELGHTSTDGFMYGYSFFSRRKDATFLRGYEQSAIVILTHQPWPSLFYQVGELLGPMYLAHGGPMLESACHNIAGWAPPIPGTALELGFLGSVLHVELPVSFDQLQSTDTKSFQEKYDPRSHILASLTPRTPSVLCHLAAALTHLWSLWECLVLCEPLLIFGQSPAVTSQVIWWLLDLTRPIPFAGDFRPYFTIHDKDYSALVNKARPKAGVVLGVTNPIFATMCKHWPHKLSLGRKKDTTQDRKSKYAVIAGPLPGWQTDSHNRYISKDRELLGRIEAVIKKGDSIDPDGQAAMLLRRHFTARSAQLLVPLNRYFSTLITPSSSSKMQETQLLKTFNRDHFMASLKTHGSPLPFRSTAKKKEFYERWLRSPVFGLWLAREEEKATNSLRRRA